MRIMIFPSSFIGSLQTRSGVAPFERRTQSRATSKPTNYTRGTNPSGTLERAGGIGGLLARSHGYSGGTWSTHNFYQADGNGNITYMVNSSQSSVAAYKYDPFGNLISSSGSLAGANVYRFSSKEQHVNSGMYYYGFRFYDPNLQRWINRDPIGEQGGTLAILRRFAAAPRQRRTVDVGRLNGAAETPFRTVRNAGPIFRRSSANFLRF